MRLISSRNVASMQITKFLVVDILCPAWQALIMANWKLVVFPREPSDVIKLRSNSYKKREPTTRAVQCLTSNLNLHFVHHVTQ